MICYHLFFTSRKALNKKMNAIRIGVFTFIIVATVAMEANSFGAYFVEVTRYNESSSTNNYSEIDFNKHFHRCSIKATCNYVGLCTKTKNATFYSRDIDVPFKKNWLRVWKRVISIGHGMSIAFYSNNESIFSNLIESIS